MFNKKTVRDIKLHGKTILLRADYNVPLDEYGRMTDDYRIQKSLPTIRYLLDQDCRIAICSHLGRPKGPKDKNASLRQVAKRLSELLDCQVLFSEDCVGEAAKQAVSQLKPKGIVVLENLRYHKEEEANDSSFAQSLAELADVMVQDAFGVVHRAHASLVAITKYLPSVAGLLLEKEVSTITDVMENPKRPLMTLVGGAKIADKIDILERFVKIADSVAIGGAMANTFLLAQKVSIGKSLADRDDVATAREILEMAHAKAKKQAFAFFLPQDGVVATKIDKAAKTRLVDWEAHVIADVMHYPQRPPQSASHVGANEMILDIGPFSAAFIAGNIQMASTVIWNGAMGVTEVPGLRDPIGPFARGTEIVIEALMGEYGHKPYSVVGGGDTVGYLEDRKLVDRFGHVSTGGGASLELMSGRKLPGVESLMEK
jgi:phosphoglycerate kinase